MKLSILIVSYNVRDLLERCLRSLERIPDDREVIVVDNDSKDGSQALLEKFKIQNPKSKIILLNKNFGFAKGNIEGYKHTKGEYVLLLNPDTKVLPNAIETMVKYLDDHAEAWVVGSRLLNEDGSIQRSVRSFPTLGSQILVLLKLHNYFCKTSSDVILNSVQDPETKNKQKKNSLGFLFSFLDSRSGSGMTKGVGLASLEKYLLPNFDYSKTQEVDQVMGAALMIRRNIIEQIGFLDPSFKRIFEEVDFCFRVKRAGGKVVYLSEPRIIHSKGESFGKRFTLRTMLKKQYYFNQGMARFFWKSKPVWQSVLLFPFLIVSLAETAVLWILLSMRIPFVKNREF